VSFFDSARPLIFAHRGGSALGPENTLAAFDLGMAAGADGLELDVHLSADGVAVVHHDRTLDRTTSASGPVASRTAAELAQVDAGCRFVNAEGVRRFDVRDSLGPELTRIPTLRDVLRRYAGVRIIAEMKVDSIEMGRAVADEVRAASATDRVCAAGFGLRSLSAARRALPEMATSASQSEVRLALYRSWARWPVKQVSYDVYQVPELAGRLRVVTPRFIRHAHASGFKVQVWTIDEGDDMKRLLAWGADALITNRPDLAVQVRDEVFLHS
jgi:glycerophosphoryl diester phosphodiesterase